MDKTVIGIVGPIASGKGTVIKMLSENGFYSSSTSDRIREELRARGEEVTRANLTRVSNELRQNFGTDILAARTAEIIDKTNSDKIVIDSIRNPDEITFFKEKYNAKIVAVVAPQDKRYQMFIKRTENSEPMTFKEFKELDDRELNGSLGGHSQRVSDCINLADTVIENNGTFEELKDKVNKILANL